MPTLDAFCLLLDGFALPVVGEKGPSLDGEEATPAGTADVEGSDGKDARGGVGRCGLQPCIGKLQTQIRSSQEVKDNRTLHTRIDIAKFVRNNECLPIFSN